MTAFAFASCFFSSRYPAAFTNAVLGTGVVLAAMAACEHLEIQETVNLARAIAWDRKAAYSKIVTQISKNKCGRVSKHPHKQNTTTSLRRRCRRRQVRPRLTQDRLELSLTLA